MGASPNQQSTLILALGPEQMANTTTANTDTKKKGFFKNKPPVAHEMLESKSSTHNAEAIILLHKSCDKRELALPVHNCIRLLKLLCDSPLNQEQLVPFLVSLT